jgi:hypothetical protein
MRKPSNCTQASAQKQLPFWHVRFPGHGVLFAPPHVGEQTKVTGLHTEFGGHMVTPGVHAMLAHEPATQVVPCCAQTVLQLPQSKLLKVVSTHAPLQAV